MATVDLTGGQGTGEFMSLKKLLMLLSLLQTVPLLLLQLAMSFKLLTFLLSAIYSTQGPKF